jgi:hypothetical protein
MDHVVATGPIYDKTVKQMGRYRQTAARMATARPATQGKLDKRLERLGEHISQLLGELDGMELSALNFWRDGITPNTYEIDHDAITARPYDSIRRVERILEEHDIRERKAAERAERDRVTTTPHFTVELEAFLLKLNNDD